MKRRYVIFKQRGEWLLVRRGHAIPRRFRSWQEAITYLQALGVL